MSTEDVRTIIRRALTEPEYMKLLHKYPEKALKGFELTEEEEAALKRIDIEPVESGLGELEERITMTSLFSIASLFDGVDVEIDEAQSSPSQTQETIMKERTRADDLTNLMKGQDKVKKDIIGKFRG